ncbi:hypothetical protein IEQ34_022459 [Dendrobium chrysotoxum]|uniref:Uncharacterized protein n=1 Tax=Dendrobium chrysotoxum TaxID=161865 RepID=A0AAV7FXU1_DENCH|nr:hypothetical protein IEQ34_022459 [Dendrobium chrysotoxum]
MVSRFSGANLSQNILEGEDMLKSLDKKRPDLDSLDALQDRLKIVMGSKKFLLILDDIREEENRDISKREYVLAPVAYGKFGNRILTVARFLASSTLRTSNSKKPKLCLSRELLHFNLFVRDKVNESQFNQALNVKLNDIIKAYEYTEGQEQSKTRTGPGERVIGTHVMPGDAARISRFEPILLKQAFKAYNQENSLTKAQSLRNPILCRQLDRVDKQFGQHQPLKNRQPRRNTKSGPNERHQSTMQQPLTDSAIFSTKTSIEKLSSDVPSPRYRSWGNCSIPKHIEQYFWSTSDSSEVEHWWSPKELCPFSEMPAWQPFCNFRK